MSPALKVALSEGGIGWIPYFLARIDYPHSDSNWPRSPEVFAESAAVFTDEEIDKVSHLNAMRHFQYDPFPLLGGRENCTVGALRAQVQAATSRSDTVTAQARQRNW